MNLTQPYGPQDDVTSRNGDRFFLGVDERRGPQQLEEGLGSYGRNLRFRRGKAEPRKGVLICPWMKGNGRTPWTEVYGGVVFSDPNANGDWFIIAADGGVWKTRPNMVAQPVPLPAGVTLTADTFQQFVPNTDGGVGLLVLLRGPTADPLVCTNLDAGFTPVPPHVGGTRDLPRSRWGLNHLNRLLLIEGKDIVAASDILAYNDFVAIQNEYRINPGNAQALVRLQPMSNATLLCFKTQSVLMVTGVANAADGSLLGTGPDTVTESYGVAGPWAVVRKGSNCYWLTNEPGVTSLRLTEQNETQDTDLRLSDPLRQTFGRINSLYLDRACLEVWEGRLYVALPLDDAGTDQEVRLTAADSLPPLSNNIVPLRIPTAAPYYFTPGNATNVAYTLSDGTVVPLTEAGWFTPGAGTVVYVLKPGGQTWTGNLATRSAPTCNAVAVYDFVNQAWCGVDEADGVFQIQTFLKSPYLGRQRLFLLGTDGTIRLYEEGYEDEVLDADGNIVVQAIPTTFRTRGYALEDVRRGGYQLPDGDRARALSAVCQLRTWDPRYTITTLNQGYNTNATEAAAVTRDRTKYDQHAKADWAPDNANDDHATPGREDYSVTLNDPDGLSLGAAGVDVDAHQTSTARVVLSNTGDWQQLEISNDQGRLELLRVTVEQQATERRSGVSIL